MKSRVGYNIVLEIWSHEEIELRRYGFPKRRIKGAKDRGSHGELEYARNEVRYMKYSHDDMKSHRCRLMSRILHGVGRRGSRGEVGNEDMESRKHGVTEKGVTELDW